MTPHAIDVLAQRSAADCAVAALAMLSGRPYLEVSEASMVIVPRVHVSGLWTTDVRRIAKKIGFPLKPARALTEHDDDVTGLVILKRRKHADCHAAVLFQGVLVDPASGILWDFDTYLSQGPWQVRGLLEPVE